MEDGISRQLQYYSKACCEKDGYHGKQALIVGKEYTVEICFLDEQTWHMTQILFQTLSLINYGPNSCQLDYIPFSALYQVL